MRDKLIDYRTAKLAKKKGFSHTYCEEHGIYENEGLFHFFQNRQSGKIVPFGSNFDEMHPNAGQQEIATGIDAPSQSLLQRWLREVHLIHITVDVNIMREWSFTGYDLGEKRCSEIRDLYEAGEGSKFSTFEEALETALLTALKLIK